MYAAKQGKTDCVEKLINAGANVCYSFCTLYFCQIECFEHSTCHLYQHGVV